ncbi:hypothetical protein HIM_05545 [Hirsutella minnesotensis 3608]|uniref:RING-type E3 ubiquitin transferase n=1 Tax=Hirsutella minnesotensis 3608 TaxID=1043627 RepID=A0A0F8A5B9_9HYPO|nr:hypothetical protein HIM_05545 [Hirsutella minnesotensis 3608]
MAMSSGPRLAVAASTSCIARWLIALFICGAGLVVADGGAQTWPSNDGAQSAIGNALQLTLSSKPGLQFATMPLTVNVGLNGSGPAHGIIQVEGDIFITDAKNYNQIGSGKIAYLSCDKPADNSLITPNKILNALVTQKPKAILLYSTSQNACLINDEVQRTYTTLFTMADAGEAGNVYSFLRGSTFESPIVGAIQGNATDPDTVNNDNTSGGGGNNSAVAMSILYSITGLITLLFLIIIATGAIRAHRYPERYGPRGAHNGRPRQSRAKGLARAVLDTIPIVKFGNQHSSKPDPQLELESAVSDRHETATQRTVSSLSDDSRMEIAPVSPRHSGDTKSSVKQSQIAVSACESADGHAGCSICTDDFTVGEDVRVLPCNHQFHPNCVDPWLVNVSGTCPLCRLDLRPEPDSTMHNSRRGGEADSIAPPLVLDGEEQSSTSSHGNRLARLLDVNRLRQAPVEERMEALRQMRAQSHDQNSQFGEGSSRRGQGARLTKKLRDKFRIRTRAQGAQRRDR